MMKRLDLVIVYSLLACWPAAAADLPAKAIKKDTIPVIGTNPFALGVSAGIALSPTANFLSVDGQLVGEGAFKGYPMGPLVGIVASYSLQNNNPLVFGATFEAHYDFSRGCVGFDCAAERKNSWLLQQGLELGISGTTLGGYIPGQAQPGNWPVPINLPSSVWSNLKIVGRGGIAERNVDLCAVVDEFGSLACASKFLWAPYVGAKLSFMASSNSEIAMVWDHILWQQGNSFTPQAALPLFQNTVTVKQEDDIKLQWLYHW